MASGCRVASTFGTLDRMSTVVRGLGGMVPSTVLLVEPSPASPIAATGRPTGVLRDELRRIPNGLNAVSIVSCWVQIIGILVGAMWWGHPFGWVIAFILMGRAHAQLAALMHEAAHRLLFRRKAVNDWVGRWLLGYPGLTNVDGYRRVHMAHHRQEFGPDEPDIPLYIGYPITPASLRRKLTRDLTGRTGGKLLRAQLRSWRSPDPRPRRTLYKILGVQAALAATSALAGYPFVYWLLWLLPYLTVWRVINRLRSIAEHGGMMQSPDRRETTHSVVQHLGARSFLVPYWIGWHLAHHCDSGVPMRHLPRFHRELIASGYIAADLEYPSYRALWRQLTTSG